MKFYTAPECEAWLSGRQRQKPGMANENRLVLEYPSEPSKLFFIARWVASELTNRQPVLLQITEWGIWSSSENWHLYYKLRQSYSDHRLLEEAPGHVFLGYEAEDFASFLQLVMLNGWGGYVFTEANYVNAFFSHDGYIEFFSEDGKRLEAIREALG